jgi:DNA mismatch repair protein MLH1
MTYVAHVTVTTITKGQLHGYRVSYRDGVMEHEPKACAAVKGTQIMVENLFYNMTARRKTLQNSSDDYSKIVDMLSRFAIHHINVNFSCRKVGCLTNETSRFMRLLKSRSYLGFKVASDRQSPIVQTITWSCWSRPSHSCHIIKARFCSISLWGVSCSNSYQNRNFRQ